MRSRGPLEPAEHGLEAQYSLYVYPPINSHWVGTGLYKNNDFVA